MKDKNLNFPLDERRALAKKALNHRSRRKEGERETLENKEEREETRREGR